LSGTLLLISQILKNGVFVVLLILLHKLDQLGPTPSRGHVTSEAASLWLVVRQWGRLAWTT